MKINPSGFTKEQIEKAMACKTAEELVAAAKAEGIELTKEEAEAFLAEADMELTDEELQKAAGGSPCWAYAITGTTENGGFGCPCKKYFGCPCTG